MKTIVDDIAVEYEDEGDGPVLLFLHGWMNTLHSFDALVEQLRGKYRLVRLDLPGFGNSETPHEAWDVEAYAKFVQHFLEKKGIKPEALVGHSFGGRAIIKGVATGSLDAKRLVLIASAGNANRKNARNVTLWTFAKLGKLFTKAFPREVQERMRGRFYAKIGSDYANAGALSEIFLKVTQEDLSTYAENIQVPTLLLWGSVDTTTPLTDGKRLAKTIKNSTLRVYEGAGHVLHRERPREVAEAIRHFV
jgi:pimeloyl-ACP methyl ester carboxylesterase